MTRLRGAVALATWLVATAAALSVSASPTWADTDGAGCAGVTVVVDPNELGGSPQVECVAEPGGAAALFVAAGFPLEYQPQLQDFVCKVDGLPTDGSCTDGDSYWSLWWARPDGEWVYSTLGVGSLEVPAGGSLGFAWHQGKGDAAPPDVPVGAGAEAAVTAGAEEPVDDYSTVNDDDSALPTWIGLGLAAVVLGAAGAVAVLRRRSG